MSFKVEKLPDEPIIVATIHEDYDLVNEIPLSDRAVRDILQTVDEPQSYIIHFELQLSFDEILLGATKVARGQDPLWHHPYIKQVILVSNDASMKISAAGMSADMFGNLNIQVFETLEDALDYVRSN